MAPRPCSSRSLRVLDTFFSSPPSYATYVENKCSVSDNTVIILTNSIRCQLRDILQVLRTIARRHHVLSREIAHGLFVWLRKTIDVCHSLFDMLQTLMDKTNGKIESMAQLGVRKRTLLIGQAQRSLEKLMETEEKFQSHLPPGESFGVLAQVSGEIRGVLSVLELIDSVLPGLLERAYSKNMKKVEKQVLTHMSEVFGDNEMDGNITKWMNHKQFKYLVVRRKVHMWKRRGVITMRKVLLDNQMDLPSQIEMQLNDEEQKMDESIVFFHPLSQRRLVTSTDCVGGVGYGQRALNAEERNRDEDVSENDDDDDDDFDFDISAVFQ